MYTKGEWKYDEGEIRVISNFLNSNGDVTEICGMTEDFGIDTPQMEANARLISAAPDLYEACKLALNFIGRDKQTRIILEKAITKAETNL